LGFYDKITLTAPAKLMIRPGLFHSTKSLTKNGSTILEVETPIDKNDLVRFKDSYGRQLRSYEGKNKMSKLTHNEIKFYLKKKINNYKIKNTNITIEKHKSIEKIINRKKNTIFAILKGGLVDNKSRYVLSPGDIVKSDTINKLSSVFKIKKEIEFLTVYKNKKK